MLGAMLGTVLEVIRLIASSPARTTERLNTCLDNQAESHPGGYPVRYREIVQRPATTNSYPFVVDVTLDYSTYDRFEQAMENRHDVRMLARIDRADDCLVHLGCSSAAVRRNIQTALG
jgi:hypothetical protein